MLPSCLRSRQTDSSGSALVISLLMIVLITVLVLTVTAQTQLERHLSAAHSAGQQARNFAQMGLDTALARIRETLSPFDDPFGSTNRPDHFWSLSPGRIDLFGFAPNAAGRPNRRQTVALHSGYPLADTNEAANLNAPDSHGHRPIWSENRKMEVDWIPVGRNPAEALSDANPIVGRFAFWVDDEGSKINVNTADGSDNYMLSSYGQGTPTAVSLSVFYDLGDTNAPNWETAARIAAEARRQPFVNAAEMAMREALTHGVSPKFPATHAFNLTAHSRSPDFNIFNEPKFQLIPSNLTNLAGASGFLAVNRMIQYPGLGSFYSGATTGAQSALRSLYPTPSQLSGARANVWPLMPQYPDGVGTIGLSHYQLLASLAKRDAHGGTFAIEQEPRFIAAEQMENWLIGKDPFGHAVTWPFRDMSYKEKYNLRQLDSITLQIFDLPRNAHFKGNQEGLISPTIAPYGILGDQPVQSAVGRYPRLTRLLAGFGLYDKVHFEKDADGKDVLYWDGGELRGSIAFSLYIPRHLYDSDQVVDGKRLDHVNWSWTNQENIGWNNAGLNETDWVYGTAPDRGSMLNPNSPWMDTLLYAEASEDGVNFEPGNSSRIDFFGNSTNAADPHPEAFKWRRETTRNGVTQVWGTGGYQGNSIPLLKYDVFDAQPNISSAAAGLWDNFSNFQLDPAFIPGYPDKGYKTRNLGPQIAKIRLRGGVTLRLNQDGNLIGIMPIDNIAGPMFGGTNDPLKVTRTSLKNGDSAALAAWRAAAANRVVPLFKKEGLELDPNGNRYVVAKVRDPLVNQLPGDWIVRFYTNKPPPAATTKSGVFYYGYAPHHGYGSASTNGTTIDYLPEPEWVDLAAESGAINLFGRSSTSANVVFWPRLESSGPRPEDRVQKVDEVASSLGGGSSAGIANLSKQKTFPSVGHLQYVRTGVMPDDETAPMDSPKYAGMPFRCLNFGPANTQGGIPDWALLDLFMVPNAIWTKPASRFAYPPLATAESDRPELIHLTYGGASTGKINLNGVVIWPWAETDTNYVRPLPLAAQFNGLRYNQDGKVYRTYFFGSGPGYGNAPSAQTATNSWKVLDAPAAKTLAEAIAGYIRQNGPLSMPGQMCDIPVVNAYGARIPTTNSLGESLLPPNTGFYGPGIPSPDGYNRTRNDLVSQSIGNLVTQGNVFSVWVTGQSLKKASRNANGDPGKYEPEKGDKITGETRMRFIVERKLDPGVDGIYGNAKPITGSANPGPAGWDGIIGTPDDLVDNDCHPPNPKFIYQVLRAEEVR